MNGIWRERNAQKGKDSMDAYEYIAEMKVSYDTDWANALNQMYNAMVNAVSEKVLAVSENREPASRRMRESATLMAHRRGEPLRTVYAPFSDKGMKKIAPELNGQPVMGPFRNPEGKRFFIVRGDSMAMQLSNKISARLDRARSEKASRIMDAPAWTKQQKAR